MHIPQNLSLRLHQFLVVLINSPIMPKLESKQTCVFLFKISYHSKTKSCRVSCQSILKKNCKLICCSTQKYVKKPPSKAKNKKIYLIFDTFLQADTYYNSLLTYE